MADAAKPNDGTEKPEAPVLRQAQDMAQGAAPTQTATPPEPTAEKKVEFSPEQQKELDRILAERLKREKEKAERAEAKAKQDAEEAALKDRQAFEELANKRQTRITELEAQTSELESSRQKLTDYEKTFQNILKAEKDGLDTSIVALLDKLDPLDQLKWLSENKGKGKPAPKSPVPPTPPPSDGKHVADAELAERRKAFSKTVQGFF